MSDTSLVFNLVARDQASGEVSQMAERFNTAAATIGTGFAAALGAGVLTHLDMEAAGDKLAAQLGVGPAEAAELSKVAASVYQDAWGDSIETVNEAVKGVYQNIGDTSQAEGGLQGVTTKALALAETFGQEVGPTTAAVGQMLKTGLAKDADEAFDILTRGFQTGANKADDLLDTINEYGTQWRKFGLDGQTAMGLISQGLKAGARDADIVADAVKEFSIRAIDGSESTADGFKAIGLSAADMSAKIGKGGDTATAALDLTLDRLRAIEDPVLRDQAAVMLFGTQAEDLGEALYSLDPSTAVAALGQVGGAAEKMTKTVGDNPKAALESFKRSVMAELGEAAGIIVKFATENQAVVVPLTYAFAGLAATVLVVKAGMATYAALSAVVTGAHALISLSCWTVIGNWTRMMAIGLMAYLRIGAAAVVSAATTALAWTGSTLVSIGTWIAAVLRASATAVAQFAVMAARAIIWAAIMAAQWLIAMGPIGWIIAIVIALAALIIANWDKIKQFTGKAWDWIWGKIQGIGRSIMAYITNLPIVRFFIQHWDKIKLGLAAKIVGLIQLVRGLPARIRSGLGNLGNLLYNAGRDVVMGLWNGIQAMGGWLRDTLIGWARNLIPGPIAKALGIASPSKYMADHIGRWIPLGVVDGIHAGQPALERTMSELVQAPTSAHAMSTGRQLGQSAPLTRGGAGGGGLVTVRFDFTGADGALKTAIQKIVRVDGRGDVQVTFGQR
ncbi:hypothetical protein AMK26_10330 [Streptomyces sp. CB03234]|uniref:phage tail tape measure protein n=1 Tax=Streptomyces sp. (strain CB03234) TaxID=1703937 RepID=UPI00093AA7EF|nr:phage tail tape measure protein [Streptomyces sp. CB03234]OKK06413.1 hypothetical protein AMK26_10330 [Streptomyces sp. CB03234]